MSTSDRELLELAARAAGYDICQVLGCGGHFHGLMVYMDRGEGAYGQSWNPLTDDGDALRLAVELKLRIETDVMLCGFECLHPSGTVLVDYGDGEEIEEPHNGDGFAATRRAIVRAAAEIGRSMK